MDISARLQLCSQATLLPGGSLSGNAGAKLGPSIQRRRKQAWPVLGSSWVSSSTPVNGSSSSGAGRREAGRLLQPSSLAVAVSVNQELPPPEGGAALADLTAGKRTQVQVNQLQQQLRCAP